MEACSLRSVTNLLVSGSLFSQYSHFSADDIKTIRNLFVRTVSAPSRKSSDVWQYFGPLYCKYRTRRKFISLLGANR